MMALAEYNRNPYDTSGITLGEVFSRFMEERRPRVAEKTYRDYMTSFNNTKPLHEREIAKLKLDTLQLFFDTCGKPYQSMCQTKNKLVTVWEYALRYEWVNTNYARMVDMEKYKTGYIKRNKAVFTPDEMKTLWSMADEDKMAEMLVLMFYTGLRVGEMNDLKTEDVDLERKCFYVRKSKTAAGVRTVPIADCILPIFQRSMGQEYVVMPTGKHTSVDSLRLCSMKKLMDQLGMAHTFHETRHTFISMMAEAGIDERITKSIVGHAGGSITETVYTHISIQPMLDAVNMLPVYK